MRACSGLTRRLVLAAVAAAALLPVPLASCAGGHQAVYSGADPVTLLQLLQSPNPQDRKRAAQGLAAVRSADAVPYLAAAVQRETHMAAMRAELMALGQSGAPAAYPVIYGHMRHPDPRIARAASAAYRVWLQYRAYQGRAAPAAVPPPEAAPAPAPAPEPAPAPAPPQPLVDDEEE
jgi:hypothetical protein